MTDLNLDKKKVAKNTILLYGRMVLLMLISLYTSRVVLNALGVVDYGIYSAVGGFVAMLGIVTNSLTAAISRFITFELGKPNNNRMRDVFVASMYIEIALAVIVVIIFESVGVWFLNTHMTIPTERLSAANWILQFSILTFAMNLLNAPYNATIIAHEKMTAFAYISIFQALGSLFVAFSIESIEQDKLTYYAFFVFLINFVIFLVYRFYCKRNFKGCRMKFNTNMDIIKKIFSFAGWNFIGASSGVLRDQGVNVILNVFCGPAVNAARGIAMQVNSAVSQFSTNFLTAINPQITKSYASGNREYMMSLVYQGARFTVYLLSIVSIPIFFEANAILKLWLKIVPEYTVSFIRLILIYQIIESVSYTMVTMMLANGKIKKYQLVVGGCQALNFPLAYFIMRFGASPECTILLSIIIAIGCLMLRLYMLSNMEHINVLEFCRKVILNVMMVLIVSSVFPYLTTYLLPESLYRIIVTGLASLIATTLSIVFIGCSKSERTMIFSKVKSIYDKTKSR